MKREVAQAFADKHGVRVFPIRIVEDESKPGKLRKEPLIKAWARGADRDTTKFTDTMWKQADGYGVMPDGYTVIDFDTRAALKTFVDSFGDDLPDTMIVHTAKGVHAWFRGESEHSNSKLITGMDVRSGSDKGWIVGPGSEGPNGEAWRVRDDNHYVAELPSRVHDFIINGTRKPDSQAKTDSGGEWDELLGRGRNVALTALKGTLLRRGVPEDIANEMIRSANQRLPQPLSHDELESTVLAQKEWERGNLELKLPDTVESITARWRTMSAVMEMAPPTYIIDPVFPEGTVNIMFGPPGSYKSFIALDWAARIASGEALPPMMPRLPPVGTIPGKRKVLYVAAEGMGGLSKRVRASKAAQRSPLLVEDRAWNLMDMQQLMLLREALVANGVQLVVYDTLRKVSPGADENKVQDMGKLMTHLEMLAVEDHITSLLIHHSNRSEGGRSYRGSSSLEGDAYNMWSVTRDTQQPLTAKIEAHKFKDAEPVNMRAVLAVDEGAASLYVDGYAIYNEDTEREERATRQQERIDEREASHREIEEAVVRLLEESHGQITIRQMADRMQCGKAVIEAAMNRMRGRDEIGRDGAGRNATWQILPAWYNSRPV